MFIWPEYISYELVLVVRQDSTSFFKMTWIDTPNGGHLSPKKVTYGSKRDHFEEAGTYTDTGVNSVVIRLLTILHTSQNRHVFFWCLKVYPCKLVGRKTTTNNQPYRFEGVGRTLSQDDNVHCVAIKGTFDDCQDIVKESGRVREDVSKGTCRLNFFFSHQFGGGFLGGENNVCFYP